MAEKTAGDYKFCPLKVGQAQIVGYERYITIDRECDGPRCAWWDEERKKCGVLPEHKTTPSRSQ